jgi:transcriptional regulator
LLQPDHGVGITRRIQHITRGTFDVKPGSLFPALHRLEERGWLASQWGVSENRRRAKYYTLTAVGRRKVDAELTNWQNIVTAIGWAIKATS